MAFDLLVYIVDDLKDLKDSLVAVCVLAGYDAYGAANAAETLALIEKQDRPAAAILDFHLVGDTTGAVLLQKILEKAKYPIYPIFMSGDSRPEAKVAALAAGGRAYEVKPVDADVLIAHLERAKLEIKKELEHEKQRQIAVESRHRATHDELTGLLNRAGFIEHALQELHEARRNGTPTACIYIDADKFKIFNDTFGHPFGDTVIRAMGECIKCLTQDIRRTDVVSRLMGDEFVVLLPGSHEEQARRVAELLEEGISNLSIDDPSGGKVQLRASAGVASLKPEDLRGGEQDLEMLLALSEAAMYAAKRKKNGE